MSEVSISDFTELIREADRLFETVGGSTRHYVSDCLLPLMEEKGMKLISTAGAEFVAGEAERLREAPQSIADQVAAIKAATHKATQNKESAWQFLTEAGICEAAGNTFEQFRQLAYQVEQDTIDYMVKEVLHPEPIRGRYGNWMSFSEALRSFAGYLLQNIECAAKMPNSTQGVQASVATDAP